MAEGCTFLYLEKLLSDLNALHNEMEKISYLKKLLGLAFSGQEGSLSCVVSEIRKQIAVMHCLLNKMEHDFQENLGKTTSLKEVQDTAEKKQNEAQRYLEVLPTCCCEWGSCNFFGNYKCVIRHGEKEARSTKAPENLGFPNDMGAIDAEDVEEVPDPFLENDDHDDGQGENERKPTKGSEASGCPSDMPAIETEDVEQVAPDFVRSKKPSERQQAKETKSTKSSAIPAFSQKILPVTPEDVEEVPVYMKGRITCDQINAVVKNLNKAMMTKYKIRSQAPSSLNSTDRSLYYRYLREESENKEGCPFIVEEDIRLFTCMKMDKRFHQIITILRHLRRLKEIRTSGIIRYAIC